MNKLLISIIPIVVSIYAILTIKLDMFWRIGECNKADNINEIILNLSYSILAAAIFYLFIDAIPYYTKRKEMRRFLRTKKNEIKRDINKAKNAIYTQSLTIVTRTKEQFIDDFEKKDMNGAYYLGIGGFKNLIEFFKSNKDKIKSSIHEILGYSEFLTDSEIEILENINSSEYINGHFFIKDFERSEIDPNFYDNQREIGESIYSINELAQEL